MAPRYDEFIFIDGKLKFEEISFNPQWQVSGTDSLGNPFHYTAKDIDLVLKLEKKGLNIKYVNNYKYDIYSDDSVVYKKTGETIRLKPISLAH